LPVAGDVAAAIGSRVRNPEAIATPDKVPTTFARLPGPWAPGAIEPQAPLRLLDQAGLEGRRGRPSRLGLGGWD